MSRAISNIINVSDGDRTVLSGQGSSEQTSTCSPTTSSAASVEVNAAQGTTDFLDHSLIPSPESLTTDEPCVAGGTTAPPSSDTDVLEPHDGSIVVAHSKNRRRIMPSRLPYTTIPPLQLLAPLLDHHYVRPPRADLMIALGICGDLLGIVCGRLEVARSTRPSFAIPEVLQPTPLQLTVPHYSWIDRWPFPRLRDNLILSLTTIDMSEFFGDLFKMDTFALRQGAAQPWDTSQWMIYPEFAKKWGFLFQ